MTLITLYLWTVVAGGGSSRVYTDWRPMGEYASIALCEKAKAQLGVNSDERARCVDTGRPVK